MLCAEQNSKCTTTYLPSAKPSKLDKQDMLGIAGEEKTNSWLMFPQGFLHVNTPVLVDQQKLTFNSFLNGHKDLCDKFQLSYLPTPPLRQDMTQSQFLSGV